MAKISTENLQGLFRARINTIKGNLKLAAQEKLGSDERNDIIAQIAVALRALFCTAQSQPSVKVVQITDRDRARAREAVRDKEERLVVRTDTVYIEKRDSSLQVKAYGLREDPSARSGRATVSGKLSAVSKVLKWICALICAITVLIIVVKVCSLRR